MQEIILGNPKIRKLLVNKRGSDEDYTAAKLNGANLKNADFTEAI
ncbi:MAG: pentapeptide repeat-containing protein [Nostoc sp. NMS1]|nr:MULTISPECIES: pentapeptide repeat-containing protein [unclassified Nostoc]MBN3911268.1 pentapeptide repeat-containing protein [Nostoc sp. NMS1]MBN3990107.1 pentapeptide repeat-containing protein [Nostoc sp. NMS2]